MPDPTILEVRLEVYTDGPLDRIVSDGISKFLEERWPEVWDIKLPPATSIEHPAEWHAIVPLVDGQTPESLHGNLEAHVLALDPGRKVRFRTRWSFQESPNHQEVYEVRWEPDSAA
jgi:hypothetical protein